VVSEGVCAARSVAAAKLGLEPGSMAMLYAVLKRRSSTKKASIVVDVNNGRWCRC
jgi:hypothetical protein